MFNNMPFNPYAQAPFYGFTGQQNQPVTQAAQMQNNAPAVLYAPTAKDFSNVSVQPGRQALVVAQNEPYIAFKNADAMGMVQTSIYRIEPVTAEQIDGPAPEYVTRQEFQQTIQQLIDGINKPSARQSKKEAAE